MEQLILECVVRSALIAVCAMAALTVLGVKAARVRHAVWTGVVILMLILPVWTGWGPKAVFHVLKAEPVIALSQGAPVQQTFGDPDAPSLPAQTDLWTWRNALLAAYLLGFGALMARLITGTLRAGRLTSESCVAPITVGWLKPSVILPENWSRWPQDQVSAVLIHENEHARHRDPLVQWFALLNRAIFWFHPLAWWLERRLSALSEEACDDAVLLHGHDPVQYSECLLGLARTVQQAGARVNVVGMAMPGTFLPQRIRRIAECGPLPRVSRTRMICLSVVCVAVSAVFTTGAIGYQATTGVLPVGAVVAAPAAEPLPSIPVAAPVPPHPILVAAARPAPPPAPVPAQTIRSFSGTVADPSGAVVANAPVTLINADSGASVSVSTNMTGAYTFQNIEPGNYKVTVKVPGFRTETQNNIHIAAGEAPNAVNTVLQLGSIASSITIVGSTRYMKWSEAASTPSASPRPEQVITTLGPMTTLSTTPIPAPIRVKPAQLVPGGPIRVGGNVQAASLINPVKPVYPADALQENVGGTVRIEAVLAKDGTLTGVHIIADPDPRLTQRALDALRQWRYQPTLLNGEPVETVTTIDVNFKPGN